MAGWGGSGTPCSLPDTPLPFHTHPHHLLEPQTPQKRLIFIKTALKTCISGSVLSLGLPMPLHLHADPLGRLLHRPGAVAAVVAPLALRGLLVPVPLCRLQSGAGLDAAPPHEVPDPLLQPLALGPGQQRFVGAGFDALHEAAGLAVEWGLQVSPEDGGAAPRTCEREEKIPVIEKMC